MKKYFTAFFSFCFLVISTTFVFAETIEIGVMTTNCSGGVGNGCGGGVSDSSCSGLVNYPSPVSPNTVVTVSGSASAITNEIGGNAPMVCTLSGNAIGFLAQLRIPEGGLGTVSGTKTFTSNAQSGTYYLDIQHYIEKRIPLAGGNQGQFATYWGSGNDPAPFQVAAPTPPVLQLNGRAVGPTSFLRTLFTPVFAQETSNAQSALIADVEIPQASITQVDRLIRSTFTLRADIAQTGIRYGLTLTKKGGENSYTDVHQEVTNDTITLGQNESKQVQASFTIPQSVPADTYAAFIASYTNKGVILASKYAGEVTLTQSAPVATIICTQPTDANADKATCIIKSTTKLPQTLNLYTVTREGTTLFGSDTGAPVKQTLSLKPSQTKTITLPLTPNVSQTLLNYLTTSDDRTVIARDTITTQALLKPTLDNVFMVATDKAITVSAITRRTNTANTATIALTLEGNNGTVCGTVPSTPTTGIRTDITLTPTCDAGVALVTLTDTNNQILDQSRIPFALDASKEPPIQQESSKQTMPWWGWIVGAIVLFGIIVAASRRKTETVV